jgi:hypothetical protein
MKNWARRVFSFIPDVWCEFTSGPAYGEPGSPVDSWTWSEPHEWYENFLEEQKIKNHPVEPAVDSIVDNVDSVDNIN